MSLVLDGRTWPEQPQPGPLLALAAAVAAARVVAPLAPQGRVGIHWPNDVYVGQKKLAGVLVEAPPGKRFVVGIGLNLNNTLAEAPAELQSTAVTLRDLTGNEHDPTDFVINLLKRLAAMLRQLTTQPGVISKAADELCLQRGLTLMVETGGRTVQGICRGIAADGGLLLATTQGLLRIASGVVLRHSPSRDA